MPQSTLHAPPDFLTWVAGLVHEHRSALISFARRRGMRGDEALDAVQDAFLTFLELPSSHRISRSGDDAIKVLTVMLRNHIQNLRRKVDRRSAELARIGQGAASAHEESSAELIARAEELARVQGCILHMARLQRAVVQLSLVDELPHEEIARKLGITAGHARVVLHRAREHLRSCTLEDARSSGAPSSFARGAKKRARA